MQMQKKTEKKDSFYDFDWSVREVSDRGIRKRNRENENICHYGKSALCCSV